MKHWKDAAPLHAPEDGAHDWRSIAEVLTDDDSKIRVTGREPIYTDMSLNIEHVRVTSSSFVGDRLTQTEEDVRPMSREDWEVQGYTYVPWDGRTCHPILTRSDELIAALGGCPMDDNWHDVNE
ncbi:hypothetical protein LXA43DRAFT_1101175 [Ganoderma leucocontextum]|nr:hypothetical protein LXA43DRAFT_1101175 [Ganoderma leucocontextum]